MGTTVCIWSLRDFLQKKVVRPAAAVLHLAWRALGPLGSRTPELLLKAHRLAPTAARTEAVRKLTSRRLDVISRRIPDDVSYKHAIDRSLVLRSPKTGGNGLQRGVILLKFTDTSRFYFHHLDIPALLERYCVVLEPSWAGYAVPEILFWGGFGRPVVVQSSDARDRAFLRSLDTSLVPVSFGASDWVDYRLFCPEDPRPCKVFDATYVANYSPGKRVHVFLRVLRQIVARRPAFRAALVCSSWGGQKKAVLDLLKHYDVSHCVALFEDLTQAGLNEILNRSRCNILLSLKEGSNRSLFEAMFADVPVLLLDENVGVNRDYINERTGMVVPEKRLAEALFKMADSGDSFFPRQWAMENISPEKTTAKLAQVLDQLFPGDPTRFTDLAVKVNTPEATYMHEHLMPPRHQLAENSLRPFLTSLPR